MSPSASGLVRAFGALSLAATLGVGAVPVSAQTTMPSSQGGCSTIDFQLSNPSPGARVEAGSNIIQGVAMATDAPSGANGIDRVDFFLGNRDEGGMSLGSAVPGMTAGPFGAGSFQATLDFPNNQIGGHELWAYAHNSVTGQEAVISEPIAIGEDVTKAFATPPADTPNMMCLGLPTGTTSTTPAPGTTTTTPATTPATTTAVNGTSAAQSITLEVGNPSPGDTIHAGAYNLVGRAVDKMATSGSGIDRIDIFLDNRDEGGLFVGSGSMLANNLWTATINIPRTNLGLHSLTVYAHSAASDTERSVTVPITVAL